MKVKSDSSESGANERAALVPSRSISYTEEASTLQRTDAIHAEGSPLEGQEVDFTEESILSQFHEDALRQAGLGSYQWLAMVTTGLGLSADSIELFAIPYLLPNIEVDLCSQITEKGWVCAITFLGMVIGSLVWGSLGDQMGRKCTLISALSVSFLFNTIAAFMPTLKSFITARFCSAIGAGGVYPLAMLYFSEFLPRASRGKYISWHLIFWLLGGCYVVLLARIFLPKTGMDMIIESRQHVGAWRQFLLLCAAPSIPAIIKLIFLAESPRFLLESGRDVEAMIVYQKIYQKNNSRRGQYQLSELELPGNKQNTNKDGVPLCLNKSFINDLSTVHTFWNSFLQLFIAPHLRVSVLLLTFWFMTGFSYYGLTIWFPEKMESSIMDEYNKRATNTSFAVINKFDFNENIENRHWSHSIFENCNFSNIQLSDVSFDNCTFEKVIFSNITSIGLFFRDSSFSNSRFLDTDITRENFEQCYLANTSLLSNRKYCKNGFDSNLDLEVVFQENGMRLVGNLIVIVITGFLIGQISRTRIVGIALLLGSIGCLVMWILEHQIPLLISNTVIMSALLVAWCSANVAVIESFPAHLRSSGFCLMMFASRSAGLLGVTLYHQLVTSVATSITAFTTLTALMVAAISALKLPNSQSSLL